MADGRPVGRILRTVAVDVAPLRRYRDFRLLWLGQLASYFGGQITYVALSYQLYRSTHSSLAVGLVGLFEVVPILSLAFLGGTLADAIDRRRMVLITEAGMTAVSVLLALNTALFAPQLWLIYLAAAVIAGLSALQGPSLSALLPRLVEPSDLIPAAALASLRSNVGAIVAPAFGGILIAALGLPRTYAMTVLMFALSLIALAVMRAVIPAGAEPPSVERVLEGLRYAWSRPDLLGTYIVDIIAMFFGMPEALFPALAARAGGAAVLGLLYAAPAVGALAAAATSGWATRVHRQGRVVALAATGWGLAVIGLGLSSTLPLLLLFLALAGGADEISALFRSAIWNLSIPDTLRGRLAGIELVSYSTGPALGNLESGAVASLFGLRVSILSGGILCVFGVVAAALALPALWGYDSLRAMAAVGQAPLRQTEVTGDGPSMAEGGEGSR